MNYKGCNKKEAINCIDCGNEIGKGEAIALRLKNGRLFCFCRVCDSEWSADINYASLGKVKKLM